MSELHSISLHATALLCMEERALGAFGRGVRSCFRSWRHRYP